MHVPIPILVGGTTVIGRKAGWDDGRLDGLARVLFLGGTAGLCLLSVIAELAPAEAVGSPGGIAIALVSVAALVTIVYDRLAGGWPAMAAAALFWAAMAVRDIVSTPVRADLTDWVGLSQALLLVFTAMAWAFWNKSSSARPMVAMATLAAATAMLLLFGAVHLTQAPMIASLIPAVLPFREAMPLLSGTVLVLSGLAILVPAARSAGALTVAAMFLAWVPLIHAGRILSDPASLFEWQFALTALTLAGALLAIASQGASRPGHESTVADPAPNSDFQREGQ